MARRRPLLHFLLLINVVLFFCIVTVVDGQNQATTTREDIIASRQEKRTKLQRSLEKTREKLQKHHVGDDELENHQIEHLEHKIRVYQHQIEELSKELDEEEIQLRLERAEQVRLERLHKEL